MKIKIACASVFGALLLSAAAPSRHGFGSETPATADDSSIATYRTANVKFGEILKTIAATGSLNPSLNVEVGSQLSGQIAELLVDFNDTVIKGQPLAKLDQSTFLARVNEARATVDAAKAGVKIAQVHLDRAGVVIREAEFQKAAVTARIETARVRLETASREAERKFILSQRGAWAASDVLDSKGRRESAAAGLREVEASLAEQDTNIEEAQADHLRAEAELDSARAHLAQCEAQLQSAQVDLDRTWIRSPVDGVIVGRSVTEGQTLATALEAHTLFSIAGDLRHMEIYAHVDESDIGKIEVGQDATFTVDAFPERTFTASVRQVRKAPQIVQNVVTYIVVLSVENSDNILLPGMTSLAKITVSRTPHTLEIPLAALRFNPGQRDASAPRKLQKRPDGRVPIWVLADEGKPKRVMVTTGADDGDRISVTSEELRLDDQIIVGAMGTPEQPGFLRLLSGF